MPQLRVGDAEVPDGLLLQGKGTTRWGQHQKAPGHGAEFSRVWVVGLWWRWRRGRWEKIPLWMMELDGSETDPVLGKAEPVLGLFGLGL